MVKQEENAGEAASIISRSLNRPVAEDEITPALRNSLQARLPAILNAEEQEKPGLLRLLRQPWFKYAAAAVLIIAVGFSLKSIWQKPVPQALPQKPNSCKKYRYSPWQSGRHPYPGRWPPGGVG